MAFLKRAQKNTQPSGPSSSPGGPVYDAVIDPANAAEVAVVGDVVQHQTNLHLFANKSAAAEAFSHAYQQEPNPTTLALMGLSAERDQLEQTTLTRRAEYPFPGAHLGPVPAFSRSPDTVPIVGSPQHLTHHAHQVESKRQTRRRFKR